MKKINIKKKPKVRYKVGDRVILKPMLEKDTGIDSESYLSNQVVTLTKVTWDEYAEEWVWRIKEDDNIYQYDEQWFLESIELVIREMKEEIGI